MYLYKWCWDTKANLKPAMAIEGGVDMIHRENWTTIRQQKNAKSKKIC